MPNDAMKELENYRQGLRGAADTLNPNFAMAPMVAGIGAESRANNAWGGLIGEQRTPTKGSQITGTIDSLAKLYGGIEKIPDYLKQLFGLGGGGFDMGQVFSGAQDIPNMLDVSGGLGNLGEGAASILDGSDIFDNISEWF